MTRSLQKLSNGQTCRGSKTTKTSEASPPKDQASPPKRVYFQGEGDKTPRARTTAKNISSILHGASDWEMQVDLKKIFDFMEEVAVTSLQPDIVLLSRRTKNIRLTEPAVPWEDRLAISHQLTSAKYQNVIDEALVNEWHAAFFPIEVGFSGFPATSVR